MQRLQHAGFARGVRFHQDGEPAEADLRFAERLELMHYQGFDHLGASLQGAYGTRKITTRVKGAVAHRQPSRTNRTAPLPKVTPAS